MIFNGYRILIDTPTPSNLLIHFFVSWFLGSDHNFFLMFPTYTVLFSPHFGYFSNFLIIFQCDYDIPWCIVCVCVCTCMCVCILCLSHFFVVTFPSFLPICVSYLVSFSELTQVDMFFMKSENLSPLLYKNFPQLCSALPIAIILDCLRFRSLSSFHFIFNLCFLCDTL